MDINVLPGVDCSRILILLVPKWPANTQNTFSREQSINQSIRVLLLATEATTINVPDQCRLRIHLPEYS